MVEKQFQTNTVFSVCLQKVFLVSEDLIVIGSRFQIAGTETEKARLRILRLVLVTQSCLEMNELSVLEISEKCSRLTKYAGC